MLRSLLTLALLPGAAVLALGAESAQFTWNGGIAALVQNKCERCHRPDDIAPFSLSSYDAVSEWAEDIRRVVEDRIMPPWKPVPGHGEFQDNFGLSDEERTNLLEFLKAGLPRGEEGAPPEPLPPAAEWELGDPDLVVGMEAPFDVPRAKDTYRCFVLPRTWNEDKFIDAVQIRPGDRRLVHHVILYLDSTGQAEKLDAADPEAGYECFGGPGIDVGEAGAQALLDLTSSLGGWVPGSRTQRLPEGVGLFLSKGARIVMQVHYYPAGRPGPDQTKIGLYFSRKPVERRLRYIPVVDTSFRIPPGAKAHEAGATLLIPPLLDAHAIQVVPHMHLLGRKISLEVDRPGNNDESLIRIDDWDFNWQNFYTFVKPVALPALSRVRLKCTFDNSEDNPRNPSNPLRTVKWGEGTEDEMCLGFLGVTFDRENLLPPAMRFR